jgi:hypothetical protein
MDYDDKGVPEPEGFYVSYKDLTKDEYRAKVTEVYGPAESRDRKMAAMANAAVVAYVIGK